MNKKVKVIAAHLLLLAGIYAGFFMGIDGAKNIVMFWAWFSFFVSLFAFSEDFLEILRKNDRVIPAWLNTTIDLSITAVFIWFGAWITGIAWFIHWLLMEGARAKIEEESTTTV